MQSLFKHFQNPLGYTSIAVFIVAVLGILNMFTGVFFSSTLCPIEQKTCSPITAIAYAQKDQTTATGFTLEDFDSLFVRQADSVLLETKNSEHTRSFEEQFRAYLFSKKTTFTGTGSILPYAKNFLQKGNITNQEMEYFSLILDNALKTELKNFLVKNEASLVTSYERKYKEKVPLIFDPAGSIRLFEQLQNTYSGNGQLFIVENMSRASEVQIGKNYDYVDWTATIRTSLPYLARFMEDLENSQSLKERSNSRLSLPFFIVQRGKVIFLNNSTGSGTVMTGEDTQGEVRTELLLRMYLSKVTTQELQIKRDEVQKQIDQAQSLTSAGAQIAPANIVKYDQLVVLSNERVILYREALRANNLRLAYNELTTLQEIYTELLTYFS